MKKYPNCCKCGDACHEDIYIEARRGRFKEKRYYCEHCWERECKIWQVGKAPTELNKLTHYKSMRIFAC